MMNKHDVSAKTRLQTPCSPLNLFTTMWLRQRFKKLCQTLIFLMGVGWLKRKLKLANVLQCEPRLNLGVPAPWISGTQPFKPRAPFCNCMHFNVLGWQKVGVGGSRAAELWVGSYLCVWGGRHWVCSRRVTAAIHECKAHFSPLCGRARKFPGQPACGPVVCRHCRSHTQGESGGLVCVCVWERRGQRDVEFPWQFAGDISSPEKHFIT